MESIKKELSLVKAELAQAWAAFAAFMRSEAHSVRSLVTSGRESARANLTHMPVETATKVLAVVGFIAVLAVGTWGAAQAVRFAPAALSTLSAAAVSLTSIFIKAEPKPVAATPEEVSEFPVSGTETPAETGEVAEVPSSATENPTPVAGEPSYGVYPLGGSSATPAPASPLTGVGVDLSVRIIDTGLIDVVTNAYTPLSTITMPTPGRPAVRFVVENLGTAASGSWQFNVVLPTNPAFTFHSDAQRSLGAGDRIEYTLGFDSLYPNPVTGEAKVTVNADPTGSITEVSEENNVRSININVAK